jgi:hypothetical protein
MVSTKTAYNRAFGYMVAEGSFNEHLVRYWAFVSARQTSLNIGKLYLSLVHSQAAVPGGRISNSITSPSATVMCNFKLSNESDSYIYTTLTFS